MIDFDSDARVRAWRQMRLSKSPHDTSQSDPACIPIYIDDFIAAVLGWNSANDTTIYAAVKNKSGGTATITTTLNLLKLEG